MADADDLVALERMELSDDEDGDFKYDEIAADDELLAGMSEDEEDLDAPTTLEKLQAAKDAAATASSVPAARPETEVRPTVVDDYIRNYLIKYAMPRTLESFNTEWYELKARGLLPAEDAEAVADVYARNQALDAAVRELRVELKKNQEIAAKAQGTWDKFRKERDFHRMHHKRVMQEKNRLLVDIRRLKKHYDTYEPMLSELNHKYEAAMKEKMLMRLERDRLMARITALEAQVKSFEDAQRGAVPEDVTEPARTSPKKRANGDTKLPADGAVNPHLNTTYEPVPLDTFQLSRTFKGHLSAVSGAAFHPTKPVVATISDDMTWKLWGVPAGDLLLTGKGHSEWISGVDFHPAGTHLATSSGDGMIKLWDFQTLGCTATYSDHTQSVWDIAWHHEGDFLVSASMDHTAKLWDVHTSKCRQTFRGHVDSVNSILFQPYSNNICTASGDKTVSLWDIRSGLCIQTLYGHRNACYEAVFNLRGDTIVSCDADGIVKVWDVRMVQERASIELGEHPLNSVCIDRSGHMGAAASDDGSIKLFNVSSGTMIGQLRGHEDAVQVVRFDPQSKFLVSGSSDNSFRIWCK